MLKRLTRPIRRLKRWARDNPHDYIVTVIVVVISLIGISLMMVVIPSSGLLAAKPAPAAPAKKAPPVP